MKKILAAALLLSACRGSRPKVEMMHVPAGTFQLGGSPTAPGDKMTLREFWIDRTEVTVAHYAACVKARKCTEPNADWKSCNWPLRDSRGDHPVNCVSWDQASSFCRWVKKQLPSEEQWEMAARGADGRLFPWKDGDPAGKICANKDDGGTCPVGTHAFDRSPFGLLDMGASVREWTSTPTITADAKPARMFRGGGWKIEDGAPKVSVLERSFLMLEDSAPDLGFRCSTDLAP